MKSIEALYDDNAFLQILEYISNKNLLPFDDYRQEVFLYLYDNEYRESDLRKIADKIAKRMKRRQIKEHHYSFNEDIDSDEDDYPSVLWEDRHVIA